MNQIRQIREAQGISQKELARRANICQSLLCNLEKERLMPWPAAIKKIAKVLKVKPDELIQENKETRDASLAAGSLVTTETTNGDKATYGY
jgi:transcriptional regulator with XRE-family HTH domain